MTRQRFDIDLELSGEDVGVLAMLVVRIVNGMRTRVGFPYCGDDVLNPVDIRKPPSRDCEGA